MFNGGERLTLDEQRFAVAAAGGCARCCEIVQINVKKKNIVVGEVGHINPFAAGVAVELHMQGHADGRRAGT